MTGGQSNDGGPEWRAAGHPTLYDLMVGEIGEMFAAVEHAIARGLIDASALRTAIAASKHNKITDYFGVAPPQTVIAFFGESMTNTTKGGDANSTGASIHNPESNDITQPMKGGDANRTDSKSQEPSGTDIVSPQVSQPGALYVAERLGEIRRLHSGHCQCAVCDVPELLAEIARLTREIDAADARIAAHEDALASISAAAKEANKRAEAAEAQVAVMMEAIRNAKSASLGYARRDEALEECAVLFDNMAAVHASQATWMGRERQHYSGARIPGVEMAPMNGPAIAHDAELARAKRIRALKSPAPSQEKP